MRIGIGVLLVPALLAPNATSSDTTCSTFNNWYREPAQAYLSNLVSGINFDYRYSDADVAMVIPSFYPSDPLQIVIDRCIAHPDASLDATALRALSWVQVQAAPWFFAR